MRGFRGQVFPGVSGSSALLVGRGLKETMAGRFEKLRLLHWSAADLQAVFSLTDDEAVGYLVRHGSYPGAFPLRACGGAGVDTR